MSENQASYKYTPGDRVRILKPAQGVPETARFIGTLGTVKGVEAGDLFVEPDAAPNYANSWWYGGDEIEFVAASGGWFRVCVWCDDDYAYRARCLVWAVDGRAAVEAAEEDTTSDDPHPTYATPIEIPQTPTLGTRVSL